MNPTNYDPYGKHWTVELRDEKDEKIGRYMHVHPETANVARVAIL